ncbi:MAG: hypothetical protein K2G63_05280, partial [Oscillospiraceae bacterium]|nr:hypothetical protein [Oscillospiraceae bacterium]
DIRIVVATETLTMGVNMPTDVMVLYDTDVNREDAQRMMTYHEYKNAIGRAGRYGKSRNNSGISYVLCKTPDDKKRAIKAYIENPEIIKITSGLRADSVSECNYALALAPYYLSILSSMEKFSEKDVLNIVKNALCRPENVDIKSEANLAKDIISIFESSYKNKDGRNYPFPVFIHEPDDYDDYYYDDSEPDDAKDYSVDMFGRSMSSFALSMNTYTRICRRFINDANGNRKLIQHHIPKYTEDNEFDIEPHDFEKKYDKPSYFFDVIFQVCSMPEIHEKKKNQYVTIRGNDSEYRKAILRFLKGKEEFFWENSVIRKYCSDDCTIDLIHEESVQPIYRTIILYYWVLGVTAPQIRKNLGFPNNN